MSPPDGPGRPEGPDVTVVIPVYNTMPYLRACLDSLVWHSIGHARMWVVAVDDGSTDGSGELLDEYAAQHPGLFDVVHQANSGGPATPCNVGLDRASGRYVFFLGADDYLGAEALERMVDRADEWGSDVLCARLVGVGGRWVNQRLFAETTADVPFPSTLLASALSNTKLFRRSVVEEHHLRFPQRRVASDQPFTIDAMHHARRVSVLADYEYYYAVKRDDAQNLTYSSAWQSRLDGIGAVVRHVGDLIPPGDGRDQLLSRHFRGEIATLLRRDLAELEVEGRREEQQRLVAGVRELVDAFLTEGITPYLRVVDRLRYAMLRAERLDDLRALAGAEDRPVPVLVTETGVHLAYPELWEALPQEDFAIALEPARSSLVAAVGEARLAWDGSVLTMTAATHLLPGSAAHVRAALARAPKGVGRGARVLPVEKQLAPLTAPVTIDEDGTLRSSLDVRELLEQGTPGPWALRLQLAVGSSAFGMPVLSEDAPSTRVPVGDAVLDVTAAPDAKRRTVIAVEVVDPAGDPTPLGTERTR